MQRFMVLILLVFGVVLAGFGWNHGTDQSPQTLWGLNPVPIDFDPAEAGYEVDGGEVWIYHVYYSEGYTCVQWCQAQPNGFSCDPPDCARRADRDDQPVIVTGWYDGATGIGCSYGCAGYSPCDIGLVSCEDDDGNPVPAEPDFLPNGYIWGVPERNAKPVVYASYPAPTSLDGEEDDEGQCGDDPVPQPVCTGGTCCWWFDGTCHCPCDPSHPDH